MLIFMLFYFANDIINARWNGACSIKIYSSATLIPIQPNISIMIAFGAFVGVMSAMGVPLPVGRYCVLPPFILSVLKLLQPSNSTFSSSALCTGHRYHYSVPSQSAYLRSRCIEMCHPALKFMALSETTCISLCRYRRDKRVGAQCVPDRRPK